MEFKPVLSKLDFVKRYKAGEFGNHAPTWEGISDFLQADWNSGLVHIRNRVKGADTWYDVRPENVPSVWKSAVRQGNLPQNLYISAMAPTEKTLFQGEVMQSVDSLNLTYTCVALPMRRALAINSIHEYGIITSTLLRHYLCPNSYEWLETLLDRYPGHVVEFSVYSVEWGTLPGYNTVFWEIRDY